MAMAMAAGGGGGSSVDSGDSLGLSRRLASTDKKVRDRAIDLLTKWLECRDSVEEADMKKIWKGLFYCFWHTDKSEVQAEIASKLAELVCKLKPATGIRYFEMFLVTIRREWGGIDHLRLDKFYMLIRKFLVAVLRATLTPDGSTMDVGVVTMYMDVLRDRVLLVGDLLPAQGVSLHIADIYLDELRMFLPLSVMVFAELIRPFEAVLARSSERSLMKRVRECVFYVLRDEGLKEDGADDGFGPIARALALDERFFGLASAADTPQMNRGVLYWLQAEFKKLKKVAALTSAPSEPEDETPKVKSKNKKRKKKNRDQAEAEDGESEVDLKIGASESEMEHKIGASESGMEHEVASGSGKKRKKSLDSPTPTGPSKRRKMASNASRELAIFEQPTPTENGGSSVSEKVKKNRRKKKTSSNPSQELAIFEQPTQELAIFEQPTPAPAPANDGSSVSEKVKKNRRKKKSSAKEMLYQPLVPNLEPKFEIAADEVPPLQLVPSPLIVGKQKKTSRKTRMDADVFNSDAERTPVVSKKRKMVPVSPLHTASKKRRTSPGPEEVPETPATSSKKRVHFALKRNTIWMPTSPRAVLPDKLKRASPTQLTPKSALKQGVPPGPVRRVSPRYRNRF